jgi:PAS domain S-box-containing protein
MREMKESQSLSEVAELLGESREAAFVVDPEGRIVLWNPAAEAFLGVPAGEAIGRHCATVVRGAGVAGRFQCTRNCPLLIQAERDDSYVVREMRVPGKPRPASWRDVRVHHVPLEDDSGKFGYLMHVITPAGAEEG